MKQKGCEGATTPTTGIKTPRTAPLRHNSKGFPDDQNDNQTALFVMDTFFGLFFAMGCNSMFFDHWSPDFDVIGALPLEVAIIILRKLDGKSLVNAAQVSSKWLRIIKFDRVLRNTVKEELARQRQERLKRQMNLCDSASVSAHSAAFYPSAKKQRRNFENSVKTSTAVDKPLKARRAKVSSTARAQLRKLR